jgi:hypothetical protein
MYRTIGTEGKISVPLFKGEAMSKENIYMKTISAKVSYEQVKVLYEKARAVPPTYDEILAEVDIYDVIEAFKVQPALVNAVKKVLQPGNRKEEDAKPKIQDLEEAINGIRRVIEIETIKENLSNLT